MSTDPQYLRLASAVRKLVLDWDEKKQQHVINIITNCIRRFKGDIYDVEVSLTRGSPFQYSAERVIRVSGKIFYIYFQVD